MGLSSDLRRATAGLGYTLAGVVDVAAEQAKEVADRARAAHVEAAGRDHAAEMQALSQRLQQAPTVVFARGLEAASRVQATADGLAERGRRLVGRLHHEGEPAQEQDAEPAQVTVRLDRGRSGRSAPVRTRTSPGVAAGADPPAGVRRTRSEAARRRTAAARSGTRATTVRVPEAGVPLEGREPQDQPAPRPAGD